MMFIADLITYFVIVALLAFLVASDAVFLANGIDDTEFRKQKKVFDASEYLLWQLAPVEENAVQHHKIDLLKADGIDCNAIGKDILLDNFYISVGNKICGSKKTKTAFMKRIALCENGFSKNVCILEVGA